MQLSVQSFPSTDFLFLCAKCTLPLIPSKTHGGLGAVVRLVHTAQVQLLGQQAPRLCVLVFPAEPPWMKTGQRPTVSPRPWLVSALQVFVISS